MSLFVQKSENNEKFQSLMKTSRQISSFHVHLRSTIFYRFPTQQVLQKLKILLEKFSSNIKEFVINSCLQVSDFLEILNLIPNVESISLYDFLNEGSSAKKRCMGAMSDLNLHHLKELFISSKDMNIVKTLVRLPVGLLKKLRLEVEIDSEVLKKIVEKQPNIESFYSKVIVSPDIINHLKLKELSCCTESDETMQIILQQQTSLRTLTLEQYISNKSMEKIKKLKYLEELSIVIDDLDIKAIKNLPKVRKLQLMGSNFEFMKVFSEQNNSHINFLTIESFPDRFTLEKISISTPNLKSIQLFCEPFSIEINNILELFNNVEKLIIKNEAWDIVQNGTSKLCLNNLRNENLKVLEIHHTFRFKNNFAQKIVESYPNLEKLVVSRSSRDSIHELITDRVARTETLKKLDKLKEISIDEYPLVKE